MFVDTSAIVAILAKPITGGRPGRIRPPGSIFGPRLFFAHQHVQSYGLGHRLVPSIIRVQMITAIVSRVDMLWVLWILDDFIKID